MYIQIPLAAFLKTYKNDKSISAADYKFLSQLALESPNYVVRTDGEQIEVGFPSDKWLLS